MKFLKITITFLEQFLLKNLEKMQSLKTQKLKVIYS